MGLREQTNSRLDLTQQRFTARGDLTTKSIEGVADPDRFAKTWDALRLVGVDDNERDAIADLLEVTLLLGDVDVEATSTEQGEGSKLLEDAASTKASQALGVDTESLGKALTERTVKSPPRNLQGPAHAAAGAGREGCAGEGDLRADLRLHC